MGGGRSGRLTSVPLVLIFLGVLALEGVPHLADLFKRQPPKVPAHMAVVWVVRSNRQMEAFDWSGHLAGTLDRVASSASPDGQRLWAGGELLDAQGDVLATPRLPSDAFTWAAGSDGLCGYDAGLWVYSLAAARVRQVDALPERDGRVAGCSFARDLALVTGGTPGSPTTLWWIRLRDGAVLAQKRYQPWELGDIQVSPDFRYFAENYYRPQGIDIFGLPNTVIRQVAGGAQVSARPDLVTAFSADGRDVATVAFGGGVVGVFTLGGVGVWSRGPYALPDLYAGPRGTEFVGERLDPATHQLGLLFVRGDGSTASVRGPFSSLVGPG